MPNLEDRLRPGLTGASYVARSARLLWSELGVLLLATLGALLIATPWLAVVSLDVGGLGPLTCALFGAPAWAALIGVAATAARGECIGIGTMLHAIRREYRHAVALGAATAGFAWAFERAAAGTGDRGGLLILALAAASAATLVVLVIDLYAFPLLALHQTPLRQTVRLALVLAVAAPGATLGLLAAGALACVALAQLGPGTLLLTLPVLAVLHVTNTLLQLERLQPHTEEI